MSAIELSNLEIDPALDERLERIAEEQGRPKQFIVEQVIGEYVLREEELAADRREIAESLEHYRRTGLHLTNDEVMAWLDRLANGEDVPPPECHT